MAVAEPTPTIITRQEWRRVLFFAFAVIALTTLPYLLAAGQQNDRWRFSGGLFGLDDHHSYLAKMRLGARGEWNFSLFYTAEPHDSAPLTFLAYILPGQAVGLFMDATDAGLTSTLALVYHLMRVVFSLLLILMMYRFVAEFLDDEKTRFMALVLATLGGGFGWMLILTGQTDFLGSLPADFYIPEGFTFIILLGLPHLALARSSILGGLLLLLRAEPPGAYRRAALAGLLWNLTGIIVPFYLAILYAILGAWGLMLWFRTRRFPWDLFRRAGLAAGMTLPLFAYNYLLFSRNPAFAQWSAQNLLASPHPVHYLLGYGVFALLACVGGWRLWGQTRQNARYALLTGWPLIVPFLVYLPLNVQRRMAEAVILPLAILAAVGTRALVDHFRLSPRWIPRLVYGLLLTSSLVLLLTMFVGALVVGTPAFQPAAKISAIQWLNENSTPGEVVFSNFATGNIIPAHANLRVFLGHGPETLFADRKRAEATAFFDETMPAEERRALLESQGISYVFHEVDGRNPNPAWAEELALIYDEAGYQIYRVPD